MNRHGKSVFQEAYYENKKTLLIVITLLIVMTMFFFYGFAGNASSSALALTGEGVAILGGSFVTTMQIFATNANIALSPSVALSASAALSIWGEFGTLPSFLQGFSFGLMDSWFFRIFAFLWAIVFILPRCTQITHIGGLVIEDVEQKFGMAAMLIISFSQFVANFQTSSVFAAPYGGVANTVLSATTTIAYIVFTIVFLTLMTINYYFIRTFMFFIDILLMPFCTFIPTLSSVVEFIKIILVHIMYIIAIFAPWLYLIIYTVLLAVSIICFHKSYPAVQYFKTIYVKGFIKKLLGYKKDIPLVHPKAPAAIRRALSSTDVKLLLPVYCVQGRNTLGIKRYQKWWLVADQSSTIHFYQKKWYKGLQHLELPKSENASIYCKSSIRFFELFEPREDVKLQPSFRKLKKNWHFVFSKEYFYRFDEILSLLSCNQYTVIKPEKYFHYEAPEFIKRALHKQ